MAAGLSAVSAATVRLIVQPAYRPQIPTLVRVELLNAAGQPDRDVWAAEALLTASPAVTLSTNRIALHNGLGTALVSIAGPGDFDLRVDVGPVHATRTLRDLSGVPITPTGGTLAGSATTWSGVVMVTNDLTVPAGHTLTVEPNTLVLVTGVAGGTTAPDLFISGTMQCLGTEAEPITITCATPGLRWGQIRHNNAQPSLYRYTSVTRAGRAPGEGHTGQAPAVRPTNSRIVFENCTISDHAERSTGTPGKIMQASGSDLLFDRCVLARARMGPEIAGTALLFTNSYILEMYGPDDADGIYIHDAGSQVAKLVDSVIAFGNDDGIDTLGSFVNVERCIIRDWLHPTDDSKGISAFNRVVNVTRSLVVNCVVGISGKAQTGSSVLVFINESTIIATSNSVAANWKSNAQGPVVDLRITNSIVLGPDPIKSDFGTTNFSIGYCVLGEDWSGTSNTVADPAFVDLAGNDFHLRLGSPCIDAGNPASPVEADGSRIDIGCFTFVLPNPLFTAPKRLSGGHFEFQFSAYTNRNYEVQYSTNGLNWGTLTTISHLNDPETITDSSADSPMRLYRARLVP